MQPPTHGAESRQAITDETDGKTEAAARWKQTQVGSRLRSTHTGSTTLVVHQRFNLFFLGIRPSMLPQGVYTCALGGVQI